MWRTLFDELLNVWKAILATRHLSAIDSVQRGDELGMFHLGSTVVVLLESGLSITRTLGTVRYGEALVKAA